MNTIKHLVSHLVYLPTTLVRAVQLILPRSIFVKTYNPCSDAEHQRSQELRNAVRRADYEAKKLLWGRK